MKENDMVNVAQTNDKNRGGFTLTDAQIRQYKTVANQAYPVQGRAVVVRRPA
jgi:hypothetical protein